MPSSTTSADGKHRILIMDDEEYIRSILSKMFDKFGYDVELTAEGDEAVERYNQLRAQNTPVALSILDLSIPGGMGGKETALKILESDPGAKILISTGNPNDPLLNDHKEIGIKGILSKPFRLDTLMTMVEQIINTP